MRGSITYDNLMYQLGQEDIEILSDIVKENFEMTKETKLPLI